VSRVVLWMCVLHVCVEPLEGAVWAEPRMRSVLHLLMLIRPVLVLNHHTSLNVCWRFK